MIIININHHYQHREQAQGNTHVIYLNVNAKARADDAINGKLFHFLRRPGLVLAF